MRPAPSSLTSNRCSARRYRRRRNQVEGLQVADDLRRSTDRRRRGMAIVTVLLATALLLVLVAVLLDLGTIQLQRATADLRSLQAIAGADAGTAWVRGELEIERGDVEATIVRIGQMQGKHRFTIDDHDYVVVSVLLI